MFLCFDCTKQQQCGVFVVYCGFIAINLLVSILKLNSKEVTILSTVLMLQQSENNVTFLLSSAGMVSFFAHKLIFLVWYVSTQISFFFSLFPAIH